MNVLFLYTNPINANNGGVQKVTRQLAKEMNSRGIKVFICTLFEGSVPEEFYEIIVLPDNGICSYHNGKFLVETMRIEAINLVINQDGLANRLRPLLKMIKEVNCKIVSVLHNSPSAPIADYISKSKFLGHTVWIFKIISVGYWIRVQRIYYELFRFSDSVVVLSDSYLSVLKSRLLFDTTSKLRVIQNPLTLDEFQGYIPKENIVLYVGRMDNSQKRVDELLRIWKSIEEIGTDFRLVLLGDGPALDSLKKLAIHFGLKNYTFMGRASPAVWYAKSKVLFLTSRFEGYPLVLTEALQEDVIPISYNSFSALSDIIQNRKTGRIIKNNSIEEFVNGFYEVVQNLEYYQENIKNMKYKIMSPSEVVDKFLKL